jgi:outer membrane receptor protein involved in Fe transport
MENSHFGRFELRTFLQAQVYDQTFSAVSADRNTETLTRLQRVPSQAAGGSLFWTRTFGDHALASSVEFREIRGFSDEVGFAFGVPTSRSRAGGRERTVALFAQDLWHVHERFTLSLGGRFDRWRNFDALSATRILSNNNGTTFRFPERTESAFSPRIAAIISATDRVSLYGSYSRSFRAPTLNELYRSFRVGNVVTQANENLNEETADTLEAGASFRSKLFAIRGNAFVTTITDPVVSITLSSTPSLITRRRQNVGETRSRGLELDVEFEPRPEINFSASYLFVNSRITEYPADQALVGNFLPQVAPQQLTFQMRYRPNLKWVFGIQARASSGQFEDDLNTLRLRPYFSTDATAAYKFSERASLFVAAENVFNSRYDIGLTPNPTVGPPASIRAGLRINLAKR